MIDRQPRMPERSASIEELRAPQRPSEITQTQESLFVDADPLRQIRRKLGGDPWPRGARVGEAVCLESDFLRRELNLPGKVYLWIEFNRTGTHKDRAADVMVKAAINGGAKEITIGTCGNYGEALALFAHLYGIKCKVFIPEDFADDKRVARMAACGADLHKVSEKECLRGRKKSPYDKSLDRSRQYAEETGAFDANAGGANGDLLKMAYASIGFDMARHFHALKRPLPGVIAIPTGDGELFRGVADGIHRAEDHLTDYEGNQLPEIEGRPRFVACVPRGDNPIADAVKSRKLEYKPYEHEISPSEASQALAAQHASRGVEVCQIVKNTGGWISTLDPSDFQAGAELLNRTIAKHPRFPKHWPKNVIICAAACVQGFRDLQTRVRRGEKVPEGPYVGLISGLVD